MTCNSYSQMDVEDCDNALQPSVDQQTQNIRLRIDKTIFSMTLVENILGFSYRLQAFVPGGHQGLWPLGYVCRSRKSQGIKCTCEQCVPGSFSPSLAKSLGMRLDLVVKHSGHTQSTPPLICSYKTAQCSDSHIMQGGRQLTLGSTRHTMIVHGANLCKYAHFQ